MPPGQNLFSPPDKKLVSLPKRKADESMIDSQQPAASSQQLGKMEAGPREASWLDGPMAHRSDRSSDDWPTSMIMKTIPLVSYNTVKLDNYRAWYHWYASAGSGKAPRIRSTDISRKKPKQAEGQWHALTGDSLQEDVMIWKSWMCLQFDCRTIDPMVLHRGPRGQGPLSFAWDLMYEPLSPWGRLGESEAS